MVRVWRLEADGRGIYNNGHALDGDLLDRMTVAHHKDAYQVAPAVDSEVRFHIMSGRARFGCASPELLMRWFGEFLPLWIEAGARVCVYEVGGVVYDDGRQVIFSIDGAEKVDMVGGMSELA